MGSIKFFLSKNRRITIELEYKGTIYRPPVEANTLLLPVTEGCSHNTCRFCNMYKDVKFRMLTPEEIETWLKEMYRVNGMYKDEIERIYLVGADPFAISASRLELVIELIRKYFPNIKTVTMYAAIRNIMSKTDAQLKRLHELGVNELYVGVESGLEDVLKYLNKGNTVEDVKRQCARLNAVGIKHMALLMPGAAGKGRGEEHAIATAELINEIKPAMVLLTTMSAFPGTELDADVKAGKFIMAGEKEILTEEKIFLERLNLPSMYFWAAHSLDSVRIAGFIGKSRQAMLDRLQYAIDNIDEELFNRTFQRNHL